MHTAEKTLVGQYTHTDIRKKLVSNSHQTHTSNKFMHAINATQYVFRNVT